MDDQDYRGQHLAPGPDSGAPMHDLSQVYPEDVYGPNGFQYYGETGEPSDRANFSFIQSIRGKPNAPVTVYRAVPSQQSTGMELAKIEQDIANYMKRGNLPKDAITQDKSRWYDSASHQRDLLRQKLEQEKNTPQPKITINAGDWVTPNKKYAIDHGNSALNGKYKILSKKVLAKELYTAGDSHHEWGYHPSIKKEDGGGITAYHGSPHDFEQFDTSKIGTGEGAQVYGHGLYFAEHEPVAKQYRDQLAGTNTYIVDHINEHAPELVNKLGPLDFGRLKKLSQADQYTPHQIAEKFLFDKNLGEYDQNKLANAIASHRNASKGHMYEVNINAHPHHFLDWDKPMHQQSPYVQNILQLKDVEREAQEEAAHHFKQYGNIQNMPPHIVERINHLGDVVMSAKPFPKRGSEFYLSLQHDLGGAEEATKHLQNRGIRGIRYLDAGSRNTDNKPTYNYVVFNDKDVHIKRKYEQGGRVGFDIGGAVPEVPTLGGVQAFFDQANLVNQQRDAQASQVAYQQALAAQQQKEAADAAAKAAASAKPKEGLGSDVGFGGGGGGGEGGGGGGIGGGLGSDFGGGIGGRDSNNADATGTTGGNAGEWHDGGRIHYNTGGPVNVSKAEDTAGNFKKEHEKIHGIPVAIEVKDGHDRVKYNPDGSLKFKAKQYADYGAILGTKDADGMDTDVMVGPHKDSERAYIIDQRKHKTGKFDEHKVLLGFKKRKKAIKAYTKSYADRHGKDRVQDVVKTDIKGLKKWLKNGDLKRPAAHDDLINSALRVVSKKA